MSWGMWKVGANSPSSSAVTRPKCWSKLTAIIGWSIDNRRLLPEGLVSPSFLFVLSKIKSHFALDVETVRGTVLVVGFGGQ